MSDSSFLSVLTAVHSWTPDFLVFNMPLTTNQIMKVMPKAATVVAGIRLFGGAGAGAVPTSIMVVAPHMLVKTAFVSCPEVG